MSAIYSKNIKVIRVLLVILLLLIGAGFRLFGLAWGIPNFSQEFLTTNTNRSSYHPDEGIYLSAIVSMEPAKGNYDIHDYHWGSLHMYLVYGALELAEWTGMIPTPWQAAFTQGTHLTEIYSIGRIVSVFLGMIGILITLMLGITLSSWRVGFIAASVYATAPLAVVESHFLTGDITASVLSAAAILSATLAIKHKQFVLLILSAFLLGLAIAAKYIAIFALPSFLIACWGFSVILSSAARPGDNNTLKRPSFLRLGSKIYLSLPLLFLVLGFVLGEPYIILSPNTVIASLWSLQSYNRPVLNQSLLAPLQVLATQLYNFFSFGLTWPLTILGLVGLWLVFRKVVTAYRGTGLRTFPTNAENFSFTVLLAALLSFTLALALNRYAMLRYTQPLIPLTAILIGIGVVAVPKPFWRWVATSIAILLAMFISLSEITVLSESHPANEALQWVQTHIPPGKVISQSFTDYPPIENHIYKVIPMVGSPLYIPYNGSPDCIILDDIALDTTLKPELKTLLETKYQKVVVFDSKPHVGTFTWFNDQTPADWRIIHPSLSIFVLK